MGYISNRYLLYKITALNNRLVLVLGICVGLIADTNAQQRNDSLIRQSSINNVVQFYYKSVGLQAHLYNGPLYDYYPKVFTEGFPYFKSNLSTTGSVSYDGLHYDSILMTYDLVGDELIIFHPVGNFPINLIKNKVDSFSLYGHSFIHIKTDSQSVLPGNGFFDQLYSSPAITFLAKRRKSIQEMGTSSTIETKVHQKTTYYISKKGVAHVIRNKNSVLNLMKERKSELQQYIKRNSIRFKKNFEADVLSTVKYYDQLMKPI
jgi:hypothetical protein